MAKRWYLKLDGRQMGPLPSEQVQRMAARGQIKAETLLRPESQEEWLPASTWPQLFGTEEGSSAAVAKREVVPKAKAMPAINASPPVVKAVSVATPRGIPVGAAVGTPKVVPTGKPVGTAVKAPPPQPPAPPTAAPAGFAPIIVTDSDSKPGKKATASVSTKPNAEDDEVADPKQRSRLLVLGLGGAAVAIAIVGGLMVAFNPFVATESAKPPADKPELAAATKGPEADPTPLVEEEPPTAAVSTSAKAPLAAAKASEPQAKKQQPAQELLRKVKKWASATATRTLGPLKLQVGGIWLAKPSSGEQGSESTAETIEDAATPKYLCVEVILTNVGANPLNYRGWNGLVTSETAGVLLNDDSSTLELAPPAEIATERLKSRTLNPKESVTDVLVFAAPPADFEKLRLMLPYRAINGLGADVSGIEIPATLVATERPAADARPGRAAPAGKAPKQETEEERLKRQLAESLGGEKEDKPNEPKPDAEMPEAKKGDMKEEMKPALPADAAKSLKDFLDRSEAPKPAEKPK